MFKVVRTVLAVTILLAPLTLFGERHTEINLGDPRFNASGQGDVTTIGSIADGVTALNIAHAATWREGHGIRVRRAGDDAPLHDADSGWTVPPGAPGGVAVVHDAVDRIEGSASARCSLTGAASKPVDLCEVIIGGSPTNLAFDEVRLWIKSSVATREGDLRLRTLKDDRVPTFDLDIPALTADKWTEVFVELKRRRRIGL